jgi:hypothetical protein
MVLKIFFKIFKRVFGIKRKRVHPKKKYRPKKLKRGRRSRAARTVVKKKSARRSVAKKAAARAVEIGTITHYFPQARAAVVKLKKPLHIGEPIWVRGMKTDFRQTVSSLQMDRKPIDGARAGQEIGLGVQRAVRPQDKIFRSG